VRTAPPNGQLRHVRTDMGRRSSAICWSMCGIERNFRGCTARVISMARTAAGRLQPPWSGLHSSEVFVRRSSPPGHQKNVAYYVCICLCTPSCASHTPARAVVARARSCACSFGRSTSAKRRRLDPCLHMWCVARLTRRNAWRSFPGVVSPSSDIHDLFRQNPPPPLPHPPPPVASEHPHTQTNNLRWKLLLHIGDRKSVFVPHPDYAGEERAKRVRSSSVEAKGKTKELIAILVPSPAPPLPEAPL